MKLSYTLTREDESHGWSGDAKTIVVYGDEFEVWISESGVNVRDKRNNAVQSQPIFRLPLPLPTS